MDIQTEKANIINQFKLINDIDLINAIKSLLEYARSKEKTECLEDIPENHQATVRSRVRKYKDSPDSYLTWQEIEHKITTRK